MWWENERVVRHNQSILNYPTTDINIPPLVQWNPSVSESNVFASLSAQHSPLYPGIAASATQSTTYTPFPDQHQNLGHYFPPPAHEMLPNHQQHTDALVPFHSVMPNVPNYQSGK